MQDAIVSKCNSFKSSCVAHAREKKQAMQRCFFYSKNKLFDDDLLPMPSTKSDVRASDNSKKRPQLFLPITRQVLKNIYSQIKLSILPNDEDFFRFRATSPDLVDFEDVLTLSFKKMVKKNKISEKIGGAIWAACWSGLYCGHPKISKSYQENWNLKNEGSGEEQKTKAVLNTKETMPDITFEAWNPINFYIDPTSKNPQKTAWVYIDTSNKQDIIDNDSFFNRDLIKETSGSVNKNNSSASFSLSGANGLSDTFLGSDSLMYDLYYFPYLKVEDTEYRNMIIGIVDEKILCRFHPNMMPKGMNPAIFTGWVYDPENPYSFGPAEDMAPIQRHVNMLQNFKIEDMARNTNFYATTRSANLENAWGVSGGIVIVDNPTTDFVKTGYDSGSYNAITNEIGILKADAQILAGSQNPFQGSAQIDFKKTATEIELLNNQFISVIRDVIITMSSAVEITLTALAELVADYLKEPIVIDTRNKITGEREFIEVDFSSLIKTGKFEIEMVNVNQSTSKQAQIAGLTQLMQLVLQNPESIAIVRPIIEKIGLLQGEINISDLLNQLEKSIQDQKIKQLQIQNQSQIRPQ